LGHFEWLIVEHRAPAAFHAGVVHGGRLCDNHGLDFIGRLERAHGAAAKWHSRSLSDRLAGVHSVASIAFRTTLLNVSLGDPP
jgi:hypothetical protein